MSLGFDSIPGLISFGLSFAAKEAGEDIVARAVKSSSLSAIISRRRKRERKREHPGLFGLQYQEPGEPNNWNRV